MCILFFTVFFWGNQGDCLIYYNICIRWVELMVFYFLLFLRQCSNSWLLPYSAPMILPFDLLLVWLASCLSLCNLCIVLVDHMTDMHSSLFSFVWLIYFCSLGEIVRWNIYPLTVGLELLPLYIFVYLVLLFSYFNFFVCLDIPS